MISPEDIKQQALKWWKPFLQSQITGDAFFPRSIDRIGKVHPGHVTTRFDALQQEIETLYNHSKHKTGTGYSITTASKSFRRTGSHELPEAIAFDTIEDYVTYIGRKKEWKLFLVNSRQIIACVPFLKSWIYDNCSWLTQPSVDWGSILKVCLYFIETPQPNLYIRQLPVEVHTKFIEENNTLMQSLLDFLIPGHIRSPEQKRFAERYFLKYDEPLIRIRILDEAKTLAGSLADISIPLSDFEKKDWPAENILITENKMNFLCLPALPTTIAVWSGGGFNVSYLRNGEWLGDRNIFYWGDIDEHGLQILQQLRGYYPHVKSIMMDLQTFHLFNGHAVNGQRIKTENLNLLTEDEAILFRHLKSLDQKNRLEQEKIPQKYVNETLFSLLC
jgi:hypothetical protein